MRVRAGSEGKHDGKVPKHLLRSTVSQSSSQFRRAQRPPRVRDTRKLVKTPEPPEYFHDHGDRHSLSRLLPRLGSRYLGE